MNAPNSVAFEFDARTVDPLLAFEPIPEGWYKVIIKKSNIKATKAGDGGMLSLEMAVIEGQHVNRSLFTNLNLFNQNQQAVDIAYKTLSAISYVTGVMQVRAMYNADTSVQMLHNIPFLAYVTIREGQNGKMNDVRGYKDVNGNEPGKAGTAGPPVSQPGFAPPAAPPPGAPPAQQWGTPPAAQQPAAAPAAPPAGQWGAPAPGGQPGAPGAAPWGPPGR